MLTTQMEGSYNALSGPSGSSYEMSMTIEFDEWS